MIFISRGLSRHTSASAHALGAVMLLTSASKLEFTLRVPRVERMNCPPDLHMLFLATKQKLRTKLRAVFTSSVSGYVTPPGYPFTPVPSHMKASHTIHAHKRQAVMLSFRNEPASSQSSVLPTYAHITLSKVRSHANAKILWSQLGLLNTSAAVYNSSINIKLQTYMLCVSFKIYFSFHTYSALPHQLQNGLFNCSVVHYTSFKNHLHCNLKQECEGKEDEGGHCPFSSPACDGKMAVGGTKCYSLHVSNNKISWLEAQKLCQAKSGQLATMRFKEEVRIFLKMLRIASSTQLTYIGLVMDKNVPNLYRHIWRWHGSSIAYSTPSLKENGLEQMGCYALFTTQFQLRGGNTGFPYSFFYACEHYSLKHSLHSDLQETEPKGAMLSHDAHFSKGEGKIRQPLTVCPGGFLTHDFLKCDLQAACLVKWFELNCPLGNTAVQQQDPGKEHVSMFVCDNLIHTIPYTLVCSFVADCPDGSDEKFCQHDRNVCELPYHKCSSGQCISLSESRPAIVCDRVSDCYDESDESSCESIKFLFKPITVSPPARIDFDQNYMVTATALDSTDACPVTHFKCVGPWPYCLPVYVLCNGYYDCPLREDELHCKNYVCPGFYRCRGTNVCVHMTQLCDGVAQCQGRDDELLCEFVCPLQCQCQGWSFVCRQSFPARSFAQLRYLDASHSLMTLSDFVNNHYLIWLSLSSCQLQELSNVSLGNLQRLHVSNNLIKSLEAGSLSYLPSLKEIGLSDNPLVKVTTEDVSQKHTFLEKIDMSLTRLSEFDCEMFTIFPMTTSFNFSHCGTVKITKKMFSCFTHLSELDIRGTNLAGSQLSFLGKMHHLEAIFSDNYRHCCSAMMATVQHEVLCLAPLSGFSSCSDLVRSQVHRAYLWTMAILSFVGNACCLLARRRQDKKTRSPSIEIFLFQLLVANLAVGMYLCITVVAGLRFRGNFVLHERDWVESYSCRTAGFLALLATQISCLVVFLMSVDRLVAVCYSSKRLQTRSVWLLCFLSWLIVALLASVSTLVSAGERDGTTSLCISVPTLKNEPSKTVFHLGVLVVFRITLALITLFNQSVVFYQIRSTYVIATNIQISQDMLLAKRVMTLIVTDVIWRLVIAINGLLAYVINVDLFSVLFVLGLPLKPVLNPLLYTNSLLAEKRKLTEESRLLMMVKRNCQPKVVNLPPAKPKLNACTLVSSFTSDEDVLSYLRQCLQSEILNSTDVERILVQYENT